MNINVTKISALLFFLALTCMSELANAAVYSCEVDGKKVFQGTPCAGKDALEQSGQTKTLGVKNVHSSWFSKPNNLPTEYKCNNTGCTCQFNGNAEKAITYRYNQGNKRLLLPLSTFKDAWARYYRKEKPDARIRKDPAVGAKLDRARQAVSCAIVFRQHAIQKFYPSVSSSIKNDYERLTVEREQIYKNCGGVKNLNLQGDKAAKWIDCTARNKKTLKRFEKKYHKAKSDLQELKKLTRMMSAPVKEVIKTY